MENRSNKRVEPGIPEAGTTIDDLWRFSTCPNASFLRYCTTRFVLQTTTLKKSNPPNRLQAGDNSSKLGSCCA